MGQHSLRATFMRAGTSDALMFHRDTLFDARAGSAPIFLAAMGGSVSSLSKVCVVGLPTRLDGDVDDSFASISVGIPVVDHSASCSNLSLATASRFAVEHGRATVYCTARRLFTGEVFYRAPSRVL